MNKFTPAFRDFQSRFGLLLDVKVDIQRRLRRLRKRPFEIEYAILQHLKPEGNCAIDVGANRGQSIEAIRLYHPNVPIHAFEPNEILSDKLVEHYSKDTELTIRNFALGSEEATRKLYVPYYRDFLYDGLASFTKARAADWLNSKSVWNFNPSLLTIKELDCTITQLDNFTLEPFFLKIHVQGFEKEVLEGAETIVETSKPVILLAYNDEAHVWLTHRGWELFRYYQGRLTPLDKADDGMYNSIYLNRSNVGHQALITELRM